ncbi:ABC transporter ATP-binding protein [Streptomyces sp. DSM 41014]|uniref:ABC transporter ATP-binding protein n=1 Tax=Streptomyces hintoniae TaxID=3075521 RepID=A0ABU2UBY0_9ACTN|nr:ABC transporter ATP-binding protein [Streptomyces sp. DSM 41014]MDT0470683.1 ABC transporter ATP-binding protein [Streptomyces sp. DSM 41014]
MTLLDVRGLTVRTDEGRTLVDDLSFTVGGGERLGLIGESGSGKSLTTLAVLGLLPAGMTATGSVELAGTQIVGAPEKRLTAVRGRDAAVVFQEPLTALDPLMRVGRQIAGPLGRRTGLRGAALRAAVVEALEQVRLPDPARVARAFPHEISGGQRQRVALAMALACAPALLIADEPTTALDVSVQAEILALLDTLVREREMAVLFVSHDLAVVAQVTDRALVLKDGRAVEEGPVLDVVGAPRAAYTRSLVAGARTLQAALDLRSSR